MSDLGELVKGKVEENAAEKTRIIALAVSFVASILENHEGELTREEIKRATDAARRTCDKMEVEGVYTTAYDLFLQTVEMLEEYNDKK